MMIAIPGILILSVSGAICLIAAATVRRNGIRNFALAVAIVEFMMAAFLAGLALAP